ncbi:HpaA [Pasteurella multocida subsp. multocida str. Anand1_buffalo]|nr:HpaA [Pasteurella multocida subsp. multocida str. Anand1_buffalo]
MHYLTEGSIALQLDAHEYRLYAPCFLLLRLLFLMAFTPI